MTPTKQQREEVDSPEVWESRVGVHAGSLAVAAAAEACGLPQGRAGKKGPNQANSKGQAKSKSKSKTFSPLTRAGKAQRDPGQEKKRPLSFLNLSKASASVKSQPAGDVGDGASTARRTSAKQQSTIDKLKIQADKYLVQCNTTDALLGASMKTPLYQSDRILKAMKEHDEFAESMEEFLKLQARRELVEQCELLSAKLYGMSEPEAKKILSSVCAQVDELPVGFMMKILVHKVKNMSLSTNAQIEAWASVVEIQAKPATDGSLGVYQVVEVEW